MERLTPGKYTGMISNYGITTTKAGDPQVAILFNIEDRDGDHHEMTWYGSLKEGKGREITLKALLVCGMRSNDIDALSGGVEGGALDESTPVTVTLQNEQGQDGRTHLRLKWINRQGGGNFASALTREEAKAKLGALNIKGELMALRQTEGVPLPKVAPKTVDDPGFRDADESFDKFNPGF